MTDTLREIVDELASEVEQLREENENLRERVDALEDENEDLRERVEELEERKHVTDEHEMLHNALDTRVTAVQDRLAEVEDAVEATTAATDAGSAKAFASEDPRKMLPIEKLAELPDDVAKQQLDNPQNRNLYRARYVWENWDELDHVTGTSENRGSHLKSADVKRTLNTWDEEDTHVESKTVERVFRRLEEWTFWVCEQRHRNHERRLWRPEDWHEQREAAREEAEMRGHHLAGGVVSEGG